MAEICPTAENALLHEAEAILVQSRLERLRNQMNPHFLFNALNSIEALSREDPARIPEVVRALSQYLRYTLQTKQDGFATVQEELDAVASYLRVEKVRFEDQLQVALQIAETARGLRIPQFLLQPLVENAIKHGMDTSPMPLHVAVSVRCQEGGLQVEVRNTGTWSAAKGDTASVLESLQRRLDVLYPRDGCRITAGETAGWVSIAVEMCARDEG